VLPTRSAYRTWTPAALGIGFGAAMLLAAIYGAMQHYTPVPYADMLGVFVFYESLSSGDWSVWWAQHNEHRIVLARILFWLDWQLADGTGLLLLCSHFVMIAIAVWLFWQIVLTQTDSTSLPRSWWVLGIISAWLYQWMQYENIVWTFQSQFFLAQLLPLGGLYCLLKSTQNSYRMAFFVAALAAGLASYGSMANGVLALPLMTLFAGLTGFSRQRVLIMTALSAVMTSAYFYGYQSPAHHHSAITSLASEPLLVIHFTLLYLGNPFYHLLSAAGVAQHAAIWVATGMGLIMILTLIVGMVSCLSKTHQYTLTLMLSLYLCYIIASALGTAGGRALIGLDQALVPRYSTPALMAWSATLIIAAGLAERLRIKIKPVAVGLGIVLAALMMSAQLAALQDQRQLRFERSMAALALAIGIRDDQQVSYIYQVDTDFLALVAQGFFRRYTLFAREPYAGLKQGIAEPLPEQLRQPLATTCLGHVDLIEDLADEPDFVKLSGWIFDNEADMKPAKLIIVDEFFTVRGYGLTGMLRDDVATQINPLAGRSGFRAYVQRNASSQRLSLRMAAANCQLDMAWPESTTGV
jgi:hypothetical protein